MQTFKDKQQQLFKWEHLPKQTRRRLEEDWCGIWQREVLPMIDENLFSDLYCANDGRPSKSTADMVSLLILKEKEDLTDEETARRLAYGLDWQYALDLTPEEAYVARRTLQYFRGKVMRSKKHQELFADITARIITALETRTGQQRKDSTHIMSNMANLSRLRLFTETISLFLKQLRKAHPRSYGRLDSELKTRYVERKSGCFGDARGSEARRRLDECAKDAWILIERYKKSSGARSLDSWRLLKRLFNEQCEVEEGEKIILRTDVASSSMQSPHDEDAGYSGHKGKGYQVQITETCDPENETQIITQVEVESADISDAHALVRGAKELAERGLKPEEIIADTAYCGGENDIALRDMGVELTGPAAGRTPGENDGGIAMFETTPDLKNIEKCPLGVSPVSVKYNKKKDTVVAVFDKKTCSECAMRIHCKVKRHKEGYTLKYSRKKMATAKRRLREKTEEFKKAYNKRAAIEGTNSELKRAHGLGRLRVRGQPAVEFVVYIKTLACNLKRYFSIRAKQLRKSRNGENALDCGKPSCKSALSAVIVGVFNAAHDTAFTEFKVAA